MNDRPFYDEKEKPSSSQELRSLFQFLHDESEASRTTLREESKADRELLFGTIKIVSSVLGILILIAGYFGYRSIEDVKQQIIAEAKRQTNAEIKHMEVDIDNRLNEQFKTPNIQQTIQRAAREATVAAAEPLIKSEVASQVKVAVNANHGIIRRVAREQTDFYRIRDFRAQVTLVFPTDLVGSSANFVFNQPMITLSRNVKASGERNVAQFHPLGGSTRLNAELTASYRGEEKLFPPFEDELLNKPLSTLDGTDKITLHFPLNGAVVDAKEQAIKSFRSMTEIHVQFFLNSVSLGGVRFAELEIQKSMTDGEAFRDVNGHAAIVISKDVSSLFQNTKAEFDRRFEASSH